MNSEKLNEIAGIFSALGEPMRLRILYLLMKHEMNVGEISKALNATKTNISKHLKRLTEVKIVSFEKSGTFVNYKIYNKNLKEICKIVCSKK